MDQQVAHHKPHHKSIFLRPDFSHIDEYFDNQFKHFEHDLQKNRDQWLEEWKKNKPSEIVAQGGHYRKEN